AAVAVCSPAVAGPTAPPRGPLETQRTRTRSFSNPYRDYNPYATPLDDGDPPPAGPLLRLPRRRRRRVRDGTVDGGFDDSPGAADRDSSGRARRPAPTSPAPTSPVSRPAPTSLVSLVCRSATRSLATSSPASVPSMPSSDSGSASGTTSASAARSARRAAFSARSRRRRSRHRSTSCDGGGIGVARRRFQ